MTSLSRHSFRFLFPLGAGFRIGFLGLLHMDVFRQRLEHEYDANVVITAPSVPYKGLLIISNAHS